MDIFFLIIILVNLVYPRYSQRVFLKVNHLVIVYLILGGMVVYIFTISIQLNGYRNSFHLLGVGCTIGKKGHTLRFTRVPFFSLDIIVLITKLKEFSKSVKN